MTQDATTATQGFAADLILDPAEGCWKAIFQGKVIARSKSRDYIIHTISTGLNKTARACGVTHVKDSAATNISEVVQTPVGLTTKHEFSIQERFDFLANLTQMTIDGSANAVLVTGEGGLGKTHTVMSEIKQAGLTFTTDFEPPAPSKKKPEDSSSDDSDADDSDDEEEIAWVNPGQVHVIKGFSSAKGLYRTLFENNGKLIIFDDCDSIQRNTDAVNILKGALDSSDERWISWNAEEGRGSKKLPRQFRFTGRVIFISNWAMHRIDGNLRTRCLKVDLSMTASEKIERMRYIAMQPSFMPHLDQEIKNDAIDFLEMHAEEATSLSLRSMLDTIKFRTKNAANWQRQALYSLTS